jgi:hypothetical protein
MYRSNGLVRLAFRVFAAVVGTLVGAEVARAQGSLTTSDGMRLGLSSSGSVIDLQVGGVDYASSSIVSGFVFRELPATSSSSDPFGGRVPAAFGGTVSSDSGGITQTASKNGVTLNARFTNAGTAIRVDVTLTDTTGSDRPIELGFRLPLNVAGWSWEQNFVTSLPISTGTKYESLDASFGGTQKKSNYPFATVRNGSAAFTLATRCCR